MATEMTRLHPVLMGNTSHVQGFKPHQSLLSEYMRTTEPVYNPLVHKIFQQFLLF